MSYAFNIFKITLYYAKHKLEQDRGLPLRLASRQATATLTEHQTATPSPQHPRCPRASVQENKKKKVYNTLKQRHVS